MAGSTETREIHDAGAEPTEFVFITLIHLGTSSAIAAPPWRIGLEMDPVSNLCRDLGGHWTLDAPTARRH